MYLNRVNSDVIGSSVEGEPIVFITAFVVLIFVAFARPVAESVVSLAWLAGFTVGALLLGGGVTNLKLLENEKGPAGAYISYENLSSLSLVGMCGFVAPSLLGLAGAHLVLHGLAWSLLWVVLVLLALTIHSDLAECRVETEKGAPDLGE